MGKNCVLILGWLDLAPPRTITKRKENRGEKKTKVKRKPR